MGRTGLPVVRVRVIVRVEKSVLGRVIRVSVIRVRNIMGRVIRVKVIRVTDVRMRVIRVRVTMVRTKVRVRAGVRRPLPGLARFRGENLHMMQVHGVG